ncbi:MAG: RagB/SusD family nutrient uptake outer membrane protein [Bacteroidales bacterium]|jgi:hypothetical protein|nr:RagB/SusD family nutrient uptake outer membrane protein [Bacteroidales bacterium]
MKTKYLILIALAAIFSSCSESFLDTVSTDTYNEENFWKTETQFLSAINGSYAVTREFSSYKLYLDNVSPNSYNMSGQVQLAEGTHDISNERWFTDVWNLNYRGIGRVNNVLAHIAQPDLVISESIKTRITGEAYFLRALFYFELINLYGGVPLITDAPDFYTQKNLPRDSKDAVLTQILKDLDEAQKLLPPSYSGGDIGRATQGAALALKARILLYESRWTEAASAAKAIIDLNRYSLFKKAGNTPTQNYRQLFLPENENNQEVIFDIQYSAPDYTHGLNLNLDLQLNIAPLPDLVNSYLASDGKPTSESSVYDPAQPYENRDPRLHATISVPGYLYKNTIIPENKYYSTGYAYKKYTTYLDDVTYATDVKNSPLNYIYLRYGDILLMYAEAKNEAGNIDQSVYDALHLIRDRAGMPDIPQGLSQGELRNVIRLERRIELANEGLYYNDIRRWRTAETVMNTSVYKNNGDLIQTRSFNKDRDYLWPISLATREQNPKLEQNPNYGK